MRTLFLAVLLCGGCKIEKRPESRPFADDFSSSSMGEAWSETMSGLYRLSGGELVVKNGYNHPLWLRSALPRDAVIELDAWSNDEAGDIKIEAWGDGKSFAQTTSYTATSYVFILGGWHNQISAIARMNEHGADRRARSDVRVVKGQHYHFRITRKGGHIDWQVDGRPFLTFDDPDPLDGADHSYFGFNDWEAELHFDNLKITPL